MPALPRGTNANKLDLARSKSRSNKKQLTKRRHRTESQSPFEKSAVGRWRRHPVRRGPGPSHRPREGGRTTPTPTTAQTRTCSRGSRPAKPRRATSDGRLFMTLRPLLLRRRLLRRRPARRSSAAAGGHEGRTHLRGSFVPHRRLANINGALLYIWLQGRALHDRVRVHPGTCCTPTALHSPEKNRLFGVFVGLEASHEHGKRRVIARD